MIRVVVSVGLMALVSGCASSQKVLDMPTTATFKSASSAKDVATCISEKNGIPVLEREDGTKVLLLKNYYGNVSLAFTIIPDGSGSVVEYRKSFGTIGGKWKQCIGPEAEI